MSYIIRHRNYRRPSRYFNSNRQQGDSSGSFFGIFFILAITFTVSSYMLWGFFVSEMVFFKEKPVEIKKPTIIQALPPAPEKPVKPVDSVYLQSFFHEYIRYRLSVDSDIQKQADLWSDNGIVALRSTDKVFETFKNEEAIPLLKLAQEKHARREVRILTIVLKKDGPQEVWEAEVLLYNYADGMLPSTVPYRVRAIIDVLTDYSYQKLAERVGDARLHEYNPNGCMVRYFKVERLAENGQDKNL